MMKTMHIIFIVVLLQYVSATNSSMMQVQQQPSWVNVPIFLKTAHGEYIRANVNGDIAASATAGQQETFTIVRQSSVNNNTYVLRTYRNTFIQATPGRHAIVKQSSTIVNDTLFTIVPQSSLNVLAIKTIFNSYLRASAPNALRDIDTSGPTIGLWEQFTIVPASTTILPRQALLPAPIIIPRPFTLNATYVNKPVHFKCLNGFYMSAHAHDYIMDYMAAGPQETFTILPEQNSTYSFHTAYNRYVYARSGIHSEDSLSQTESKGHVGSFFTLWHQGNNVFAIKTIYGTYFSCAGHTPFIEASSVKTLGDTEKFKLELADD